MHMPSFLSVSALAATLLAAPAAAHFSLTSPAGRGFTEDLEPIGPCGGFNTTQATRSSFPLTGGNVTMMILDGDGTGYVNVNIGLGDNPTNFTLVSTYPKAKVGSVSFPVDLSKYTTDGKAVTLQLVYHSDEIFFQCADLTVGGSATSVPSMTMAPGSMTMSMPGMTMSMPGMSMPTGTATGAAAATGSSTPAAGSTSGAPRMLAAGSVAVVAALAAGVLAL
ncbi:uncharacterized protein EV422DRAFT_518125 [Fimicolochytrium jonesii]|uniref:uncharacterized protein n=1 Tax=Fimicolochytrium jonesii TaxID=1396493 RepID=UPI0022FEB223|nr:uncharacterized protein EV422DRAFT_518125 [Fimicolochytrium jonesii]KAI8825262.1 hypothetical protein EV422DRAFT_518125 [Fimicolochytrium jonesii]